MNIEDREIIGEDDARSLEAAHAAEDARPIFEDIEQRTLMSAASLEGHTLTINVDEGNDHIELDLNDDASVLTADVNGERQSFAAGTVYVVNINAGNGNNWVALDARIGATTGIVTGSGRDTIYGGMGGDFINSGGNRDTIDARAGNDSINAGSGNDKINAGSGNDFINAGSGNDSLSADGGLDKLLGRSGNDKLYADKDDVVQGDGGKDKVYQNSGTTVRDDGYEGPAVRSVTIVNADTGAAVQGYEKLTKDTILDASKLPQRYTIVASVDDDAKSVSFNITGDKATWRKDSDGTFSATNDATGAKFVAWQPTAGGTYTLQARANTAAELKGINGDMFQIKLTHKPAATGAGTEAPSSGGGGSTTDDDDNNSGGSTTVDPAAPKIKLNVLTKGTVTAGQGFHAEATGTTIAGYQVEDAKFEWDFGDPAGKFNKLPGFNAGHVYDKAGTYTVTLTVTGPGGKVSKATQSVVVKAASYTKTIYVAANGNDNNEGASQDKAVKTIARAAQLAGDNTRILIRRGDTFGVVGTATIENDNVEVGTYGVGAGPVIRYEGARVLVPLIRIADTASNVAINGLTFTSIYDDDADQTGMCHAINTAGFNITIRNNTFLHVGYGINNNGFPDCVYIGSNSAPLDNGVRGYLSWTQGSNFTIVGNTVANSTREHAIRTSDATNVTIAYNDLANLDRRYLAKGADPSDYSKSAINVQRGAYVYVAQNQIEDGVISMGPLGGGDGTTRKDARFNHGVIEGNTIDNARVEVQHGSNNVTVRDNVIDYNDGTAILVRGWNVEYGRGTTDLVIDHNVAFNDGKQGRFADFESHTSAAVVTNNVYVAPNLAPGSYGASAIVVNEGNLSGFKTINGNVWPTGKHATSEVGDLITVGGKYITAAQWNAYSNVGTDRVQDASESDALKLTTSMLKAA